MNQKFVNMITEGLNINFSANSGADFKGNGFKGKIVDLIVNYNGTKYMISGTYKIEQDGDDYEAIIKITNDDGAEFPPEIITKIKKKIETELFDHLKRTKDDI